MAQGMHHRMITVQAKSSQLTLVHVTSYLSKMRLQPTRFPTWGIPTVTSSFVTHSSRTSLTTLSCYSIWIKVGMCRQILIKLPNIKLMKIRLADPKLLHEGIRAGRHGVKTKGSKFLKKRQIPSFLEPYFTQVLIFCLLTWWVTRVIISYGSFSPLASS